MSSKSHSITPLSDETIDRVARQMTDAEAPARLRANVMSRLDEARRASRAGWWLPAVTAVAAAAMIVMVWPRPSAPGLPPLPSIAPAAAPLVANAISAAEITASSPSTPSRRVIRVSTTSTPDDPEALARMIPALTKLEPLTVDSIQPQPLAIPLLVISPLSSTAGTTGGDGGK
jgi:hypothetical protein